MPTATYLTIDYLPAEHLLVGRWQRLVMPFEFQRGYAALLDAAAAHRCPYWLVDLSGRPGVLDGADVQWMREHFFPQLQPRLGGTAYLALLLAPQQLAGILADPQLADLSFYDQRPYRLQRFLDEETARAWLRQCALRDAQPA